MLNQPPRMTCDRYPGLAVEGREHTVPDTPDYAFITHSHHDAAGYFPCRGRLTARNDVNLLPSIPSSQHNG